MGEQEKRMSNALLSSLIHWLVLRVERVYIGEALGLRQTRKITIEKHTQGSSRKEWSPWNNKNTPSSKWLEIDSIKSERMFFPDMHKKGNLIGRWTMEIPSQGLGKRESGHGLPEAGSPVSSLPLTSHSPIPLNSILCSLSNLQGIILLSHHEAHREIMCLQVWNLVLVLRAEW